MHNADYDTMNFNCLSMKNRVMNVYFSVSEFTLKCANSSHQKLQYV